MARSRRADDPDDDRPAGRGGPPVALIVAGVCAGTLAALTLAGAAAFLLLGRRQADVADVGVAKPAQDMTDKPITTIRAAKPTGSFLVRGECSLGADYVGEFSDKRATHYSIILRDTKRDGEFILCYALRESADGKRLFALLNEGKSREMTFECRFPGDSVRAATLNRVAAFE